VRPKPRELPQRRGQSHNRESCFVALSPRPHARRRSIRTSGGKMLVSGSVNRASRYGRVDLSSSLYR
jgi:hypothetical protein